MKTGEITVRRALPEDTGLLLPLVEEYWRFEDVAGFDPARIGGQLQRLLAEPRLGAGWIAADRGRALGYLLAVYVFSLEHGGLTAEIDEFFVLPSARGAGIGERLLSTAEADFKAAGCTNVALQLGLGNDAARKFYFRRGYHPRAGFELIDKDL